MDTTAPILIAYDGSPDARYAIDRIAALAPGRRAVVAHAREPLEGFAAGLEGRPAFEDVPAYERPGIDVAEDIAADGAAYARERGLDATAEVISTLDSAADAIVDAADRIDAELVVVGSRGRRGVRSIVLGSVSHAVLHHARRPVLVIPSPHLAQLRHELDQRLGIGSRTANAA